MRRTYWTSNATIERNNSLLQNDNTLSGTIEYEILSYDNNIIIVVVMVLLV